MTSLSPSVSGTDNHHDKVVCVLSRIYRYSQDTMPSPPGLRWVRPGGLPVPHWGDRVPKTPRSQGPQASRHRLLRLRGRGWQLLEAQGWQTVFAGGSSTEHFTGWIHHRKVKVHNWPYPKRGINVCTSAVSCNNFWNNKIWIFWKFIHTH